MTLPKCLPWAELSVEKQLTGANLAMTARCENYQKWQEDLGNGETRELSVYFLRAPNGGPFGKWTRKMTEDVIRAKPPAHAQLFVVCGGLVEDRGHDNVYVSEPMLNLPPLVERPADVYTGRLMREHHSLRHGPELETCCVHTRHGAELRACG